MTCKPVKWHLQIHLEEYTIQSYVQSALVPRHSPMNLGTAKFLHCILLCPNSQHILDFSHKIQEIIYL